MKALDDRILFRCRSGSCTHHLLDFSNRMRVILIVLRLVIILLRLDIVHLDCRPERARGRLGSLRWLEAAILLADGLISHFLHQCLSIDVFFGDDTWGVLHRDFKMVIPTVNFLHHSHQRLLKCPCAYTCQGSLRTLPGTWLFTNFMLRNLVRLLSWERHGRERCRFGLHRRLEVHLRTLMMLPIIYDDCGRRYVHCRHCHLTIFMIGVRWPPIRMMLELHVSWQHIISLGQGRNHHWVLYVKGTLRHRVVLLQLRFSLSLLH